MMNVELSVECLAEKTEVLGKNLPQFRFVHHKPHTTCPGSNSDRRSRKAATKRLTYGKAHSEVANTIQIISFFDLTIRVFPLITGFIFSYILFHIQISQRTQEQQ
jgi:hypothetical protein